MTTGAAGSRGKRYGYARAEEKADLHRQAQDLMARGMVECDIYMDTASLCDPLPGLAQLVLTVRAGDELHVTALDRIGQQALDERLLQLTELGVRIYHGSGLVAAEDIASRLIPTPHRTSVPCGGRHGRLVP